MLIVSVRDAKVVADKEMKRFYSFLYIALALAGFLMIMTLVENMVKNFPQSGYQIVAALAILILTFDIVLVVNAEMDNMVKMKLQIFSSQSTNGSQNPVHIDVREDEVKIKNDEKPNTEINLAKFISDPVASPEGKSRLEPAVGTTLTAIDNMGQIRKALGYTPVYMSTFVSLISIWNFLAPVMARCLSEFLMQKHKFPMPLMFTIELLIAFVEHVLTAFALPGPLYVASVVLGLSFGAQWPKSLRSCLVSGLHFTNRKWRKRSNKGEGKNKVLNHLRCCGYMDLKEASPLARNVAKRRLFVVFICFLIMSPAEGTFMRGIYPKNQSAQTISNSDRNQYVPAVHSSRDASEIVAHSGHTVVDVSNLEKYDAVEYGKHDSTQRTAATMEDMVPKPRKLSEPTKPQLDRGGDAQHN
ncbi:hypothetical protein SUGI_0481540 [Cryptomeria japonica]|nr:hypothetical protein SUGI_0481540 [Cryptomeria japonica]